VTAEVITASLKGARNSLVINRGRIDGLAEGQIVLGANNVIGTISRVDSRRAVVKLVTDITSQIEARVGTVRTALYGRGNNKAGIDLLPRKQKVKVGDIVYALKVPGRLDVDMIVGTVVRCKTSDEHPLLWDITVAPACDLESLTSVDVVVTEPAGESGKS